MSLAFTLAVAEAYLCVRECIAYTIGGESDQFECVQPRQFVCRLVTGAVTMDSWGDSSDAECS